MHTVASINNNRKFDNNNLLPINNDSICEVTSINSNKQMNKNNMSMNTTTTLISVVDNKANSDNKIKNYSILRMFAHSFL